MKTNKHIKGQEKPRENIRRLQQEKSSIKSSEVQKGKERISPIEKEEHERQYVGRSRYKMITDKKGK